MAKTHTLIDNFNDNSRDTGLWNLGSLKTGTYDPAVTVVEASGQVTITPRTSFADYAYAGYASVVTYDLTDSYVVAEVVQPLSTSALQLSTSLAAVIDVVNFYRIGVDAAGIIFEDTVAGTGQTTTLTYNATDHRWWRIRHISAGDTIRFDTSPDGITWAEQRSIARNLTITAMTIGFEAGTHGSEATPGTAIFDNFNVVGGVTLTPQVSDATGVSDLRYVPS